ncbi:SDR family NAD(P)-dependent oxidoreductase [Rhodococcus sp. NCIMB 12038]|uniref:SDR family NAD(P)-dependent oxidoreductase n=1 Tax=Rhodococcus sp. NCIMB 12038 TaxID=933800 RepID=UPI000B3C1544|nr:3-oxoacyl-ACP reductase family protein [Rhodococcus sp. NCIMB 12038]OUS82003.1 oxidoreductase [Rhodococcus sp. NCIMB 12038]
MLLSYSHSLDGKVAMVTGAARGIGAASAQALAVNGAAVVICDLLDDAAEETVAAITDKGGRASYFRTDVSDSASVQSAIRHAEDTFGPLDIAHNNAGTFHAAPLADLADADWARVINVNLTGVFLCMKYQLKSMVPRRTGAIVNTASVWSMAGAPTQAAYAASKHGVVGLTKTAALDYGAAGVRINAVAPGPIATAMTAAVPTDVMNSIVGRTAAGRYGQPDEVGQAVAWLCSDQASYVNGAVLPVDGGWLAS